MTTPAPSIPPELSAALAGSQSLQPAALGNTTGAQGDNFTDQIQSALTTLQSALPAAPDQASAQTLSYVIQQLQALTQPQPFQAALTALKGQIKP